MVETEQIQLQAESARQENLEARRRIEASRAALLSQSALRSQGLQDLAQRRASLAQLSEAEQEIASRELAIQEFEAESIKAEAEQRRIDEINRQIERQRYVEEKRLQYEKKGGLALYDLSPQEKEYIQSTTLSPLKLREKTISIEQFKADIKKFEKENPTERILTAPNSTKVIGIQSGAFQQEFSNVEEYNKQIADYNKELEIVKSQQENQSRVIDLPLFSREVGRQQFGKLIDFYRVNAFEKPQQYLDYLAARKTGVPTPTVSTQPIREQPFSIIGLPRYLGEKASQGFQRIAPKASARLSAFEQKYRNVLEPVEEFTTGLYQFALFGPAIAETRASINLVEPTVRVRPLAKPQAPRASGVDIQVAPGSFVFREKITIPRRFQYVNTPLQEYFGLPARRITYSRPREFIQQSEGIIRFDAEGNLIQPAITKVQQIKPLRPSTTFFQIRGGSRLTDIENIRPVNNIERTQIQRLLERERQVIRRNDKIAFFTRQGQEMFVSNLEAEQLVRIKTGVTPRFSTIEISNPPLGRRTTRATILGFQQKLLTSPQGEVFRYRFVSRDTTFPFSKPRRFPRTKGVSFIPNQPVITPVDEGGVQVLKFTKLKSPRVDVVQKQISQTVSKLLPRSKAITSPKVLEVKSETKILPPSSISRQEVSTATQVREAVALRNVPKEIELTKTIQANRQATSTRQIVIPREALIERTVLALKQSPALRQLISTRLAQSQRLGLRTVQRTVSRGSQGEPSPRPPTPKPPVPPTPTFGGKLTVREIRDFLADKEAFDVFVRKSGKEVKIATGLPKGRAERAGVLEVLKTLRASYRLQPSGKTQTSDIRFNVPTRVFTPSKRERGRVVQRRRFRLSARSEVTEIQSAKRGKQKKLRIL